MLVWKEISTEILLTGVRFKIPADGSQWQEWKITCKRKGKQFKILLPVSLFLRCLGFHDVKMYVRPHTPTLILISIFCALAYVV